MSVTRRGRGGVRTSGRTSPTLERLEDRTAPAANPVATLLNVPTNQLLGENLQFTVRFDNASPTDTGFGPYVDLYLPATGVDGTGSPPNDGISFVGAAFLGTTITATVLTLTAAGVPHPYAKAANGTPLLITPPAGFSPGDQLVVLQIPYGSFTPAQNPADIVVTTALSNLADINAPLPIRAQGGFRFGNDALDNPATDPTIVGPATSSTVTPVVYRLTKTYIGPEDETTTGPNFPRQYRISVDVATGQILTDLDLTDVLPDQLQFVSVDSTSGSTTPISTPSTTTPGGTLTRRFASVTGTSGAIDAQMTFSFYAPRIDGPLSPILDPATGDDRAVVNDSSASATWDPLDPRDATQTITANGPTSDHTLTLKSIAVQKRMTIVVDTGAPGLSPGDTVEYTLEFQVSDYFAFQNIVLTDLFSDGQVYVVGSATLFALDGHGVGGATTGAFAGANVTLTPNITGGSDQLLLAVSAELAARGFSPNGRLVGGAIPAGGTGGGPPPSDPPLPFGPTRGEVRFRTVVQDAYEIDFPSGDAALNPGDPISNAVSISGNLLSVADLTPNGNTEDDTSSSSAQLTSGSFAKSVYAVNGVLNASTTPAIKAGDTVTYQLRLTMPTGDVENLRFQDFLPLPIFDVDSTGRVIAFDDVTNGAVPLAGRAKFGPDDTFRALSGLIPTVTNTSAANSVTFDFGTYSDPTNTSVVIDILFTVTVSTDPFADQLLLSNGVLASTNNSFLVDTSTEGIAQIVLQEPVLKITKGVVATDNPTGVFTPGAVGPVTFNAPGTLGPRFTGTISSAGLAATPINSNLSNVDQGDLVTFAIVVENTGSSPNGAFDLILRDTLPEGLSIPGIGANGINLRVTDGAGNLIAFTVVESGSAGILGAIRLIDPSSTQGAIGSGVVNGVAVQNGSNIVVITFDLRTTGNRVNQIITDVATLSNYANTPGGPDFTTQDLTDNANVQIATPTATKELIGTEIVNTTNANNEAVIGELVTYRVRITVPEGTTPNAILTDTLDPELAFVGMVSSNLPGQVLLQGGSLTPVVTNSGRTITWTLGNIVNNNASNGTPEVIELVYQVVVINTADSNADDLVNNQARLTYQGGPQVQVSAPNIRIIEPQVQIAKSATVNGAGDRGDAGDPFVYTIVLSNPPGSNQFTADAFDVTFRDLLNAGLLGSPLDVTGFTVVDSAGGVTAANFELVTDSGTGQLVLRTTAGGAFDLLVDPTRTITIQISGTLAQTVTPGQIVSNDAEVRWTSLDGDPGQRSTFNTNSTERTGAGGVNDYIADDGADITVISLELSKTMVSTSETATVDPSAVVVGEIVRYRVQVAIPDFATPTQFTFQDLLPAGMELIVGAGFVAFVSNAGDSLTSSTLTDPDPSNPPDLYLTGNETNVDSLIPQFAIPASIISIVFVGGRQQITFDLGLVTNPATPGINDFEYVVVEFNALVLNVIGNQAGVGLVNEVTTLQNGVVLDTITSTPLRIAEPSITNLQKQAVELVAGAGDPLTPDPVAHDAGDVIHYAATYSNGVGADVSTAYDVRLVDVLPSAKMQFVLGNVRVFRNGTLLTTGFTNNSAGNTVDVVVDQVNPGDAILILYDAILTTGVIAGEVVTNTANLTYTSLPGNNGTSPNPTGSTNISTPGSQTGERTGDDGVGGALNDYAGTAQAFVSILEPDLDKNILDTNVVQTGSDQYDPTLTDLTVGETVTYRITITLPEGTTTLTLSDLLPLLNNGTVVFTSAMVVAIGGNLSGSLLTVGAPGSVSGNTVTFNFGTVVNSPDNIVNELDQIVVDVIGQVTDRPENVASTTVTNTATLNYDNGALTDDAVAEIVEPVLDIQKTVTPGNGDANDVFTYTVVVTHLPTSTGPAFALLIRDLLNAGNLALIPGTVTVSIPGFIVTSGNGAADTIVTIAGGVLPLGGSLTITYQARLTGAPAPGATVPNTATLDYASYAVVLGGRPYTDSDPAAITVNSNSIAGLIYRDLNNNGAYEPGLGETLITSLVTLRLTGTDHIGNAVDVTMTTITGAYTFTGLRPSGAGGYTITQVNQPAGFLDGRDTPGTPFGGAGTIGGNPRDADAITGITISLGTNPAGADYNFGELVLATVGDFVWVDSNGNGRQDVGEPGLDGVSVTLLGTDDLGTVNLSTTSAGGGLYQFGNLRPGTYRLVFGTLPSYVRTIQDSPFADDLTDSDAAVLTGLTADFTLTQGQTDSTRDAGLYQPVQFGDRVWLDLNGDGVQDPGEPGLTGVTVTAEWAGSDGQFGTGDEFTFTQITGTDGLYGFTGQPAGLWRVTVVGGLPAAVTNTGDPDGTFDGMTQFTLPALGSRTDIDFGYQGNNSLAGYVYRDFNVNGLREPNAVNPETGIAGVTITLNATFAATGQQSTFTTTTAADGSYFFDGLPDGIFRIIETQPPSVFAAGAAGYYDGLDTVGSAGGIRPAKNQFLVTFTADIDGVEYNFGENPPADPFGSVYVDLNNNGIRDPGEPGIAGVTVTVSGVAFPGTPLERPLTAADVPGGLTVVTDADGRWAFTAMPPGVFSLVEGPTPGFLDGDERNGDTNPPQTVVVGNDRFDNIVLQPFPIRGPFDFGELLAASIAGNVYIDRNRNGIRDTGEPGIASVVVTLTGTDDRGNPVVQQLATDASGNFLFTSLRPGTYTLTETQPAQYRQGANQIGSAGGAEVAVDTLGAILLGPGVAAVEYLFGEVSPRPTPVPPVPPLPIPPVDPSKANFIASNLPALSLLIEPNYQALGSVRPFGDTVYLATAERIGGVVRVFDMTGGQERFRFTPFPGFTGSVHVTTGDLTGDFIPDIVAAAGPGGGPHVKVFDGDTGSELTGPLGSFFAYDEAFRGGAYVAVGDVNGDGTADIVTGAGPGGGPHVKVFSGRDGAVVHSFYAYDSQFRGGANVAAGDVDGDGRADIVTGAGAGGGPHVKAFSGVDLTVLSSFFAYDAAFRGGVSVAVGDMNGDGLLDIVTGAGPGGGPHVRAFSVSSAVPIVDFMASAADDRGGVPITTKDLDGDGRAEIVTGTGFGRPSIVRLFDPLAGQLLDQFYADLTLWNGVFVG